VTRALVLFEDRHWRNLRPLTAVLPVPALAFGTSTLARRWMSRLDLPLLAIEGRPLAMACWHEKPAQHPKAATASEVLAVNAAALPGSWIDRVGAARAPTCFVTGDRVAAAVLPMAAARAALGGGEGFGRALDDISGTRDEVDAPFLRHPWDFVQANAEAIAQDLARGPFAVRGEVHKMASLEARERIAIDEGAVIEAFVVLDAREGPVRIGRGARVAAHTVVRGPCVVGENTELLGGSIARSTFGPQCRIAGEVEECVWQGYGNKRHHGFVGHSVIGEWVNLGALTTTSDLKNNYGSVRTWVDGREVDSGISKVGSFIGAHVKTGIGTLLLTGASVGTGSNLFGGGRFVPKRVPAFTWWDGRRAVEHRLEAFLATARIAMSRRGRALSVEDERALSAVFESTISERGTFIGAAPAARGATI
jgi:UDP-N-acetylglucosamine diphosphorylase/glucosamine-1-phosphate N-acetyltransferase